MARPDDPESSKKPQNASDDQKDPVEQEIDEEPPIERFPPDEEARLLADSNEKKTQANSLFAAAKYQEAIDSYQEAISACPHYLRYELAVLQSNVAACQLKLEQWKDAVKSASDCLKGLARVDKEILASEAELEEQKKKKKTAAESAAVKDKNDKNDDEDGDDDVEEEIISAGAQDSGPAIKHHQAADDDDDKNNDTEAEQAIKKRRDDVARIRAKALMRRARAKSELGGWSNLSGAEEDYKELSGMSNLGAADRKLVQAQLRDLPTRTKAAQEKEMSEMWGKLKDLGNGLLKPFGLSTDNFNMVKDEKTGGYSMNFNQSPPEK